MANIINADKLASSVASKLSIIKVLGVGGAGCSAVNNMYEEGIRDVDFMVCNTDVQVLNSSPIKKQIVLGEKLTLGRGAGNHPEIGRQAAIESIKQIEDALGEEAKMVFIAAGMGGGTGTGAAPVIAELCRERNLLTIAVVSIPSPLEGTERYKQALEGVDKMREYVDSILVISNDKLHENHGDLPASEAFKVANGVIASAVKGVAEIITVKGSPNIDFEDVHTVMENSKVFIMGTGVAEGELRAEKAVAEALRSPLLDSNDILGAEDILLQIISGTEETSIDELGAILDLLQYKAGDDATIIWGGGIDESLGKSIRVTVVATRFYTNPSGLLQEKDQKLVVLDDEEPVKHRQKEFLAEEVELRHKGERKERVEFLIEDEPEVKLRRKPKVPKLAEKKKEDNASLKQRLYGRLFGDDNDSDTTN